LISSLNKTPIDEVSPGDLVYVDLRWYGSDWYHQLALPDAHHKRYVLEFVYLDWMNTRRTKILAKCVLFDEVWHLNHFLVRCYGKQHDFIPTDMILLDLPFAIKYPQVVPEDKRVLILGMLA
jgi:hypothetical protein